MRWFLLLMLAVPGLAHGQARWDAYQILMWQDRTPAQVRGLAALGFTGAKVRASGGAVDTAGRDVLRDAGLSFYLENIATDFYASYHRYTPGKAVNWRYEDARARYRAGDEGVFIREPGLSDPDWLGRVTTRIGQVVRAQQPFRPLFYNLGDESGIGDLAAAWDFDMSDTSLAGFRDWLRGEYGDVAALNRQWGTDFARWNDVRPEATDAALRRTDGNFSAWSDFKAWMDVAFARAVRAGTDAAHAADPAALAAIEGAQVPGWGGYDYAKLAPTVDVMEIYDYGESLDLAMAFNPALTALRTSFLTGPRESHSAWRSVLHGGRGMVVWDEADNVVLPDGSPGPRGRELQVLAAGIGAVWPALRDARAEPDGVAMLQSQASFRVRWLLDRQAGDRNWAARDAEREYDDNAWRASRRVMLRKLAELGVQPRFIAGADIAGLWDAGVRVLLLPHAIALGDDEVASIGAFRAAGGAVYADTEPGLFDGHGRRRAAPVLADLARPQPVRPDGEETSPEMLTALAALLQQAGVTPRVVMTGPDGARATGVEARWMRGSRGRILGVQAGRPWGGPARVSLHFAGPLRVEDLRGGGVVTAARHEIVLDGVEPTVLLVGD